MTSNNELSFVSINNVEDIQPAVELLDKIRDEAKYKQVIEEKKRKDAIKVLYSRQILNQHLDWIKSGKSKDVVLFNNEDGSCSMCPTKTFNEDCVRLRGPLNRFELARLVKLLKFKFCIFPK